MQVQIKATIRGSPKTNHVPGRRITTEKYPIIKHKTQE